jgi:small subunit ribosomal protein S20
LTAAKSLRVSIRRLQIKGPLKTRAKSSIRKARISILEENLDNSNISVQNAIIALDKATKKGAIHKRNAARRKSRITRQLNKLRDQISA